MTPDIGGSVRARLPYAPIHRRPKLVLPGNARVAVWTIVNVENWSPLGAMPRAVLPPPMNVPQTDAKFPAGRVSPRCGARHRKIRS